jgi:acetoacetate decarboxylase
MEDSGRIGFLGSIKRLLDMVHGKTNLWDDARFIFADVPVDAARAARMLPWGLKLADPARATLFIADYEKTSFTVPYHEAAMLLHVRHPLGQGLHCPWMIVDDDTALIYGRELLGYPKKMGELEFEEDGTGVRASITRRGVRILSMEGLKGEPQAHPAPAFDVKTFNAGGPGSLFGVNPIWMFRPREVMHESLEMEVKLEVQPSEFDPVAEVVAGDPVSGRFVAMDIVNSRYNIPVGVCGTRYLANNMDMRFR